MSLTVEGFENMISGSLGIEEPWYISKCTVDNATQTMHIYVSVRENAKICCPKCGGETKRYGYEKKERTWQHGNVFFVYPCYVHCRRPKVLCPNCGSQQVSAPFERKNSRQTLLFEGIAMLLVKDCPVSTVASHMRCNEKTIVKIMKYWVNKARDKETFEDIRNLAIDETSFRKGHDYVSLFIDADQRSVKDVEKGRDGGVIDRFASYLTEKGGNPDKIAGVTSDLSRSFLPAIERNFPKAEHTVDKFHIKKILNDALDDVRKQEQKDTENKRRLFLGRRLYMIPESRMTDVQRATLLQMNKMYPKTGRAYRIVSALDEFYRSQNVCEAETKFDSLCAWMRRCRLEPMKEAAQTLINHKKRIINYFRNRLTNAICEGINSMIQTAKRKARGYRTFDGYATMIYIVAGKLDIDDPFALPV